MKSTKSKKERKEYENRIAAAIAYDKDSLQFSLLCFLSLTSRRALISAVFFCLSAFKLDDTDYLGTDRIANQLASPQNLPTQHLLYHQWRESFG